MNYTSPFQATSGSAGENTGPDKILLAVPIIPAVLKLPAAYRDPCYWSAGTCWLEYGDSWTSHVEALIWDLLDPEVAEHTGQQERDIAATINHLTYEIISSQREYQEHFSGLREFAAKYYPNYVLTDCRQARIDIHSMVAIWVLLRKGVEE